VAVEDSSSGPVGFFNIKVVSEMRDQAGEELKFFVG
jgi:hypothetical protein